METKSVTRARVALAQLEDRLCVSSKRLMGDLHRMDSHGFQDTAERVSRTLSEVSADVAALRLALDALISDDEITSPWARVRR